MKLIAKLLLALLPLLVFKANEAVAQGKSDIAELILAVRKGIVEAQQGLEKDQFAPMFLVREMELTISFVVEQSATGGLSIKVVSVGGEVKHERTHTVTIRSETAALGHIKDRVKNCLEGTPRKTYPACLTHAYKELGISAAPIHR